MCFAINLYNALVIHTLVVHGPKQYNSTLGRLSFFQKVWLTCAASGAWQLAAHAFTAVSNRQTGRTTMRPASPVTDDLQMQTSYSGSMCCAWQHCCSCGPTPDPHRLQAAKYNIGGRDYVLDDLENGILRGNRPAASTIGMLLGLPQLSSGPFKSTDPRRTHVGTAGRCSQCIQHCSVMKCA